MKESNYWLMKTEPSTFSIDDLEKSKITSWEGVRNYMARNYINNMHMGDNVIIYHSNAKPSSIVGLATVVKESYPDPTALDKLSPYHDTRAKADHNPWRMVDISFQKKFLYPISLSRLKSYCELKSMMLFTHGRISVIPLSKYHFEFICQLSETGEDSISVTPSSKKMRGEFIDISENQSETHFQSKKRKC